MKMAKASEKDIDAAGDAMSVLQDISSGYYPRREGDECEDFHFDPGDPWEVGFVSIVGDDYVVLSSPRKWRKAMRITHEQGHRICAKYPAMEGMPLDYNAIAKVFSVTPPGDLEYESWSPTSGGDKEKT